MKVHVHVHRRAARERRGEMYVLDLLAPVVEMIPVHVEKRVERRIEALPRENRGRLDAILAVDDDLNVVPGVRRAVVDRQPAAFKPKRIDVRRFRAREAQAQARNGAAQREDGDRARATRRIGKTHGL